MATYIGSARHDEHGSCYHGGKAGDQLQSGDGTDYTGEVSQQKIYRHSSGWNVYRLKEKANRSLLAKKMRNACNNANIGYDQDDREGILKNGTSSTTKTECDCSSLVRQCIIEATGKDPGNFTTEDEGQKLVNSGLFELVGIYKNESSVVTGDVLVTRKKGHTAIVTSKDGDDMNIDELPLVKYGSKNAYVAMLQGALKYKGYSLSVDGDFGANTTKQLRKFQSIKGLAADGQCGSKTWKAICG